jgi:hypothetical protein
MPVAWGAGSGCPTLTPLYTTPSQVRFGLFSLQCDQITARFSGHLTFVHAFGEGFGLWLPYPSALVRDAYYGSFFA